VFKVTAKRAIQGFLIGIFFLNIMCLIKSAVFGGGKYIPFSLEIVNFCGGNEAKAAILQFILTGFMGAIFGGSTVLFEAEKLSILMATVCHFLLVMPSGTAVAWICGWLIHSKTGLIIWVVQFIVLYIIIWLSIYLVYRAKVKQINQQLCNSEKKAEK